MKLGRLIVPRGRLRATHAYIPTLINYTRVGMECCYVIAEPCPGLARTITPASSRTFPPRSSSIETMFSLLCLDGERVEGQVEEVGPGKVAWMSRRRRKSILRQAEQRNNEEEHGAKRGVRGLYKLGQRLLTESPCNAICSSLPTACPTPLFYPHARRGSAMCPSQFLGLPSSEIFGLTVYF